MGRRKLKFNVLTEKKLQERLDIVKAGGSLKWIKLRHLFYGIRNKYIRDTGDTTLGSKVKGKKFYGDWTNLVNDWCEKNSAELGFSELLWFRFREALKIQAKPMRVSCEGIVERFVVGRENRHRVIKDCSLILVCEKDTISEELVGLLLAEGYEMNVVSTGGFSTGNVKEIVTQIKEHIDSVKTPNFYILSLHDFDLAGIQILSDLKKLYKNIIDVGVHSEFLDYLRSLPDFRIDLIEEDVSIYKGASDVEDYIQASLDYTMADFKYLWGKSTHRINPKTGKPVSTKISQVAKRIEIDAIYVEYGIDPFVKYILEKIEKECKIWDLSRIGVNPFYLDEPQNIIDKALCNSDVNVRAKYEKIEAKLMKPKNKIIELLEEKLIVSDELIDLIEDNWLNWNDPYDYTLKETERLRDDYKDDIMLEFAPDYEDDLENINDQIECYNGDVRKGHDDLRQQVRDVQSEVNEDALDLPEWDNFQISLNNISTGEDELEYVKGNSIEDMLTQAIEILTERLESIRNEDTDIDDTDEEGYTWLD